MNFAMMFAIALGIDYALFIVVRFRGGACGRAVAARCHGADDGDRGQGGARERPHGNRRAAGGDARARPGVPHGPARDRARGALVLAATLTLLPAALSRLGHRIERRPRCACAAPPTTAASASRLGAPRSGRDRFRTAPPPWRSCCCSPRRRSGCGPGCRRSPRRAARCRLARRVSRCSSGRSGRVRRAQLQVVVRRADRGGRAVAARARPGIASSRPRSARAVARCFTAMPQARTALAS